MPIFLTQIEQQAKLTESLLAALNPSISDVETAWSKEIEARAAAYDNGEMESISAEEVFSQARSLAL